MLGPLCGFYPCLADAPFASCHLIARLNPDVSSFWNTLFSFLFFLINLSYVLQIFDTSPPTRETILQFITNLKCKVLKNKILKVFSFGPDEYVINYVLHICYIIYKALTLNSFCPLKNALKKCEKTYKL